MANNYLQATVTPPNLPLTEHQLDVFKMLRELDQAYTGALSDDAEWVDEIEVWGEEVVKDVREILGTDDFYFAFGLDYERDDDGSVYFYAEESIDDGDFHYLQWLIKGLPEKIKFLIVEWAATCSKMRPGEFGGGAAVITREGTEFMNTGSWSHKIAVGGPPTLEHTTGNDYTLREEAGEAWITVKNISVRVSRSDEGVICDMYASGVEDMDHAHLAACYAFDSDAKAVREEQGVDED